MWPIMAQLRGPERTNKLGTIPFSATLTVCKADTRKQKRPFFGIRITWGATRYLMTSAPPSAKQGRYLHTE
jgi:hypothetical protein